MYPDVTGLVNDGIVKSTRIKYLGDGTQLFYEIKKSEPVPRMTHFEKLSFYSGGNLYVAALSTEHNSNLKHKSVKPYRQLLHDRNI